MNESKSYIGKPLAIVIDDTEVIRSLLFDALTEKGYEVKTANDATSGIALATQVRPGVIFCDTYMPDLDGLRTIKKIRKVAPDAIVVMTNSLPEESFEKEAMASSVDFILNKPFGLDELWSVLEKVETMNNAKLGQPIKPTNQVKSSGS
ncbi:MAG: response regulator [candidate division Zixibacteria bacterium]|nr:response regulator [candidate division Zixibacteria bacterium]